MKNHKVTLKLSDQKLEKSILRSLVWAGSQLEISTSDDKVDEAEFVITDSKSTDGDEYYPIYLVDSQDLESLEDEPYAVYKYSGGAELLGKISYITSSGETRMRRDSNCISLSFSSYEGGAGTTTVAFSVGIMLQRYYDKKVLYVPIMPLNVGSPFGLSIKNSPESLYTKVLYMLLEDREPNLNLVLQRLDDIDVLSPPVYNNRWDEFDVELKYGLEQAASELGYDVVVYDFGNHVARNTLLLNSHMNKNYIVVNNEDAVSKLAQIKDFQNEKIYIKNKLNIDDDNKKESDNYDIGYYSIDSLKALDEEFGIDVINLVKGTCDDGSFIGG